MSRRASFVIGAILIVLGLVLLVGRFEWFTWPMIIVAVGAAFLVAAVAGQVGPLAIPGCIVGGIGLMLYWQNLTGYWESWVYTWALIPGFVGLGMVLSSILGPKKPSETNVGLIMIVASLAAFFVAWALFTIEWRLWPVVLILVGVAMLASSFLRGTQR